MQNGVVDLIHQNGPFVIRFDTHQAFLVEMFAVESLCYIIQKYNKSLCEYNSVCVNNITPEASKREPQVLEQNTMTQSRTKIIFPSQFILPS